MIGIIAKTRRRVVVDVRTRARVGTALGLAVLCDACLATNTYTTPDAIAPDQVEAVFAPETSWLTRRLGPTKGGHFSSHEESRLDNNVLVPTAIVRFGIVERVDFALGGGGTLPRADLKVQLKKGSVALALDPTARTLLSASTPWEVELPLLASVAVDDGVMLLASPGIAYAKIPTSQQGSAASGDEEARAVWARLGFGARFTLGAKVALQPEGSWLASVHGARGTWLSAGLGIVITPSSAPEGRSR